jgi:hypothetical protein
MAVALALSAAAPAGADQVYLSGDEAPHAVFPDADRFARGQIPSTPELREQVTRRLGDLKPSIWEPSYEVTTAFAGERRLGRAIVVEEVGKHRAITLVIGVDPQLRVAGVAVMVYREAYGGEIRTRRFLDQYRGKGEDDPLLPSVDIRNITGATLSARAVGRAVRKAIAVLETIGDAPAEPDPTSTPPPSAKHLPGNEGRFREAHYVMGTMLENTLDAPREETGRTHLDSPCRSRSTSPRRRAELLPRRQRALHAQSSRRRRPAARASRPLPHSRAVDGALRGHRRDVRCRGIAARPVVAASRPRRTMAVARGDYRSPQRGRIPADPATTARRGRATGARSSRARWRRQRLRCRPHDRGAAP